MCVSVKPLVKFDNDMHFIFCKAELPQIDCKDIFFLILNLREKNMLLLVNNGDTLGYYALVSYYIHGVDLLLTVEILNKVISN